MSIFQQVKNSVSIEYVLNRYGIEFKRNKAICPFHNDKIPSLAIHKQKQIFKCFVCEVAGDSITFVAKLFNLSNIDAAKKIDHDFNLNLTNEKPSRADIIRAKRIQAKIDEKKKAVEEAIENYMYWVEKFAKFDRLCMDNMPKKYEEPSKFLIICLEKREMCWDKLKESEVKLWKLKNLQN